MEWNFGAGAEAPATDGATPVTVLSAVMPTQ
jgi:hypothetical protein